MNGQVRVERRLSPMEKYLWAIDRECRINFISHAMIRGRVNDEDIRAALDAIQARHPLLRVRIERDGWSNLRFSSGNVPSIPMRIVEGPAEEWTRYAEEDLNAIFPTEVGPLLRATLVRHGPDSSTVLLTFHHSIGDGMSGAFLIRDLIAAASLSIRGEKAELQALEPRDELETYFPSWARGFRGRLKNLKYGMGIFPRIVFGGGPTVPMYDAKTPARERKAAIVARSLDAGTVERLHHKAKEHETTLHGALLAAQILSIAQDRGLRRPGTFFVGSPVNLRARLIPPVGDDVGFFVTMGVSINRCGLDTDFWPLAREVRESLWECVEKGYPFVFSYQQKDFSRLAALTGLGPLGARVYSTLSGRLSAGGMGFSNIGRVPIEAVQDPLRIESLGFAASGSSFSPLPTFAATIEAATTWNFVGMEPMMAREHTEKIADQALEILGRAV